MTFRDNVWTVRDELTLGVRSAWARGLFFVVSFVGAAVVYWGHL